MKLSEDQLSFLAEKVEIPDDRLKDDNATMTELKEKVYCDFTLLRSQPMGKLSFSDWKAYLNRRWEHFVFMGGKFNPAGLVQWRSFYGSAKDGRSKKVVCFGIECMKYCSMAITSTKQMMRLLAEKADAFDTDVQAAHIHRDEITQTTNDASAGVQDMKKSISELTDKLSRPANNFRREPVMPDFPDNLYDMRSAIPYPLQKYNPMENPGKVDDPLVELRSGDGLSIITAMQNAQEGRLDAAIYHLCSTHLTAEKGKKTGKKLPELESFLPKLKGTEEDRANALPAAIGTPIGKLQSRLQKLRQDLDRYNVS
jgi:hypothetical protein